MNQNVRRHKRFPCVVEGFLALCESGEFLIFLKKLVEWLEDGTQVKDEFAMVVDHSKEGSQLCGISWAWYLLDGFYLVFSW